MDPRHRFKYHGTCLKNSEADVNRKVVGCSLEENDIFPQ